MEGISLKLANSIWHKEHTDKEVLEDMHWVTKHLLTDLDISIPKMSKDFIKDLCSLRSLAIAALQDKDIKKYRENLNRFLSQVHYTPQIVTENDQILLKMESYSKPESQLLATITMDLIELFTKNTILKVKRCSNEECQFFYIDYSKNRSKKFCSLRCSNLIKVRRHRANSKSH